MTTHDIDPNGLLPLLRLLAARLKGYGAPEAPRPENAACCA